MTLVYLVAGEHSGDVLGARLMAAMRQPGPGCGLPASAARAWRRSGFPPLFPMHELAVMGLMEVLPRFASSAGGWPRPPPTCEHAGRTCW